MSGVWSVCLFVCVFVCVAGQVGSQAQKRHDRQRETDIAAIPPELDEFLQNGRTAARDNLTPELKSALTDVIEELDKRGVKRKTDIAAIPPELDEFLQNGRTAARDNLTPELKSALTDVIEELDKRGVKRKTDWRALAPIIQLLECDYCTVCHGAQFAEFCRQTFGLTENNNGNTQGMLSNNPLCQMYPALCRKRSLDNNDPDTETRGNDWYLQMMECFRGGKCPWKKRGIDDDSTDQPEIRGNDWYAQMMECFRGGKCPWNKRGIDDDSTDQPETRGNDWYAQMMECFRGGKCPWKKRGMDDDSTDQPETRGNDWYAQMMECFRGGHCPWKKRGMDEESDYDTDWWDQFSSDLPSVACMIDPEECDSDDMFGDWKRGNDGKDPRRYIPWSMGRLCQVYNICFSRKRDVHTETDIAEELTGLQNPKSDGQFRVYEVDDGNNEKRDDVHPALKAILDKLQNKRQEVELGLPVALPTAKFPSFLGAEPEAEAEPEGEPEAEAEPENELEDDLMKERPMSEPQSITAPILIKGEITPTSIEVIVIPPALSPEAKFQYGVTYHRAGWRESAYWLKINPSSDVATRFFLPHLDPSTDYTVNVNVKMAAMDGQLATINITTKPADTPRAAEVDVGLVTSTSAEILLTRPFSNQECPVSHFEVACYILANQSYAIAKVPANTNSRTTSHTLRRLMPNTRYYVTVTSYNGVIQGSNSSLVISTNAMRPALRLTSRTSGTATLRIYTGNHAGWILHYRLLVSQANQPNQTHALLLDQCHTVTSCRYVLADLLASTRYNVRLAIRTALGYGPEAKISFITREARKPGYVKLFPQQRRMQKTTVRVVWRKPLTGGKPILRYDIYYQKVNPQQWMHQSPGKWQHIRVTDTNATSHVITRLSPGSRYSVKVTATNEVGTSIESFRLYKTGGRAP